MSTLERMPRHYMFSSDEASSSDRDDAPQEEDEEDGDPIDEAPETALPVPHSLNRRGIVHSLFMDKEDERADGGDDEISGSEASGAETFGTDEEWEKAASRRLDE